MCPPLPIPIAHNVLLLGLNSAPGSHHMRCQDRSNGAAMVSCRGSYFSAQSTQCTWSSGDTQIGNCALPQQASSAAYSPKSTCSKHSSLPQPPGQAGTRTSTFGSHFELKRFTFGHCHAVHPFSTCSLCFVLQSKEAENIAQDEVSLQPHSKHALHQTHCTEKLLHHAQFLQLSRSFPYPNGNKSK